jgi:hypothetical protein
MGLRQKFSLLALVLIASACGEPTASQLVGSWEHEENGNRKTLIDSGHGVWDPNGVYTKPESVALLACWAKIRDTRLTFEENGKCRFELSRSALNSQAREIHSSWGTWSINGSNIAIRLDDSYFGSESMEASLTDKRLRIIDVRSKLAVAFEKNSGLPPSNSTYGADRPATMTPGRWCCDVEHSAQLLVSAGAASWTKEAGARIVDPKATKPADMQALYDTRVKEFIPYRGLEFKTVDAFSSLYFISILRATQVSLVLNSDGSFTWGAVPNPPNCQGTWRLESDQVTFSTKATGNYLPKGGRFDGGLLVIQLSGHSFGVAMRLDVSNPTKQPAVSTPSRSNTQKFRIDSWKLEFEVDPSRWTAKELNGTIFLSAGKTGAPDFFRLEISKQPRSSQNLPDASSPGIGNVLKEKMIATIGKDLCLANKSITVGGLQGHYVASGFAIDGTKNAIIEREVWIIRKDDLLRFKGMSPAPQELSKADAPSPIMKEILDTIRFY